MYPNDADTGFRHVRSAPAATVGAWWQCPRRRMHRRHPDVDVSGL